MRLVYLFSIFYSNSHHRSVVVVVIVVVNHSSCSCHSTSSSSSSRSVYFVFFGLDGGRCSRYVIALHMTSTCVVVAAAVAVVVVLVVVVVVFSSDAGSVQQICQSTLHDFNLCMFRQDSEHQHPSSSSSSSSSQQSADDKPNRLSNEMVFKIIVICLAMIHVMQKHGQLHHVTTFRHHVISQITRYVACITLQVATWSSGNNVMSLVTSSSSL